MNSLIRINYETDQPTVSARDLHEGLEIGTRFNDWFPRMVDYGFEDGKDFYSKMSKTPTTGGRPPVDYEVSTDMAKQICMLQRSEKGKQYRQYLLDLDKAWNTPEQVMARALKMAAAELERVKKANCYLLEKHDFLSWQIEEQQKIIQEQTPKANYVDMILQSKSLVVVSQIAKDYGMSARKFNTVLYNLGIQYKINGQWLLYAKYQNKGYVHSSTIPITRSSGLTEVKMQTEWTQKGRLFLYEELKKNGYYPVIEKA